MVTLNRGSDGGVLVRRAWYNVAAASSVLPAGDDGAALGASGTAFSDLFLASGSVVNFNAGDVTLTHSAGKLTFGGDGAVELDFNSHEMTNVDINSGTIDGVTVSGTTIVASTSFTRGDTVITDGVITDSTGLQVAGALDVTGTVTGNRNTLWVQPHAVENTSTHHQAWQNYGRSSIGDGSADPKEAGGVFFSAAIPSDYSTMTKAVVVFIAGDGGNVLWDCDAQFASTGQIYSTHSGATASGSATTTAVLDNLVYEVSVIAALSGIAAGDYLGVEWVYTASSTNTNAAVLGLLLEYTT